jgi:sugar phosphate isomerase/epimerase
LEDNRVSVDVTITVDYGSPIPDVARNIQENVKKAIETMSGLDVKNVDVHVTGISFEREQRANAELDEAHRKMLEKTAEAEAAPKDDARADAPGEAPAAQTPVANVEFIDDADDDADDEADAYDEDDDCFDGEDDESEAPQTKTEEA